MYLISENDNTVSPEALLNQTNIIIEKTDSLDSKV